MLCSLFVWLLSCKKANNAIVIHPFESLFPNTKPCLWHKFITHLLYLRKQFYVYSFPVFTSRNWLKSSCFLSHGMTSKGESISLTTFRQHQRILKQNGTASDLWSKCLQWSLLLALGLPLCEKEPSGRIHWGSVECNEHYIYTAHECTRVVGRGQGVRQLLKHKSSPQKPESFRPSDSNLHAFTCSQV